MHAIFSLAYFAVHLYCTYYVWTDAKKRGMNDVLWAVIAFFGCFPVGFLIYLIARKPAV